MYPERNHGTHGRLLNSSCGDSHMVTIALRRPCFFFAMAILTIGMSSVADARHWRHHGYFGYGYYGYDRGRGEDRDQDAASRNALSRGQANGFGAAIARMIHACEQDSAELKKTPFDAISRAVRPNASQQQALEQIRSATLAAADKLLATCPKVVPAAVSERLDTLGRALGAISASRDDLRPSLMNFYTMLDDEQKAQVIINSVSSGQLKPDPGYDGHDTLCRQWVAVLRSWPVKKIESEMTLSDEQHAALYDAAAEMYRAAGGLISSCSDKEPLTPLGRLDSQQKQTEAFQRGIDAVQPPLRRFQNLLSGAQRARLDAMVDESPVASAGTR
jgi:hypothetical protein